MPNSSNCLLNLNGLQLAPVAKEIASREIDRASWNQLTQAKKKRILFVDSTSVPGNADTWIYKCVLCGLACRGNPTAVNLASPTLAHCSLCKECLRAVLRSCSQYEPPLRHCCHTASSMHSSIINGLQQNGNSTAFSCLFVSLPTSALLNTHAHTHISRGWKPLKGAAKWRAAFLSVPPSSAAAPRCLSDESVALWALGPLDR